MRALIDREREGQLQLLDGLQVSYPYGWALIFPDEEEPLYRIYSEAFSQEAAEESWLFRGPDKGDTRSEN